MADMLVFGDGGVDGVVVVVVVVVVVGDRIEMSEWKEHEEAKCRRAGRRVALQTRP